MVPSDFYGFGKRLPLIGLRTAAAGRTAEFPHSPEATHHGSSTPELDHGLTYALMSNII
jgi:hypothetical protein